MDASTLSAVIPEESSKGSKENIRSSLLAKIASVNIKQAEKRRTKLLETEEKIKVIRAIPNKKDRVPLIEKLNLDEKISYVTQIVEDERNRLPSPTIINEASNFVVITYWWGRGNTNKNLAIPCQDLYEDFIKLPVEEYTAAKEDFGDPSAFIETFLATNKALDYGFDSYFSKKDRYYAEGRSKDPLVKQAEISRDVIPQVKDIMREVFLEFHKRGLLLGKRKLEMDRSVLQEKKDVLDRKIKENRSEEEKLKRKRTFAMSKRSGREEILAGIQKEEELLVKIRAEIKQEEEALSLEIKALTKEKQEAQYPQKLMKLFKDKQAEGVPTFLSRMESLLQYKIPITFDQMIETQWIPKCREVNCNYLQMEYDDIAVSGMYQVAINAKPLFIKKALEACYPRAVLYIDGDMFINQYPRIFDIQDVDFMARGWNIDPRASPKYQREIMVDPYRFETSGGIMYYSQTPEAISLLDKWKEYSHSERQQGRADDRILSFLFNSKRLLAPMKIIQLPIEYLWLTFAYEDLRYNDASKKFNIPILNPINYSRETIFVEHPACLTSEDTAGGAGAASDREAKGAVAFEDTEYPRSEVLMESIMFPSREVANEFRPWLTYINRARYFKNIVKMDSDFINYEAMNLDYGDELPKEYFEGPLEEGVRNKNRPSQTNWSKVLGVHPFLVYPWGQFGNPVRDYIYRKNMSAIEITFDLFPGTAEGSTVVMNEDTFIIPHILKQLSLKRNIQYIPSTTEPRHLEGIRLTQEYGKNRLEFIFYDRSHYTFRQMEVLKYQYKIDLQKPMYISGTSVNGGPNPILFAMFALIKNSNRFKRVKLPGTSEFIQLEIYKAELMNVFVEGYQFLSRIRAFEASPRLPTASVALAANGEPPYAPSEQGTPQTSFSLYSNESAPGSPVANETVNSLLLSGAPFRAQGPNTFLENLSHIRTNEESPEFPAIQSGGESDRDVSFEINEKDALEFLYGSNTSVKQGGSRFRKTFRKANKKQATRRARH